MSTRICARPSCSRDISDLRADARYCSKTCRREASRERAGGIEGTKPFNWERYRSHRRRRAVARER